MYNHAKLTPELLRQLIWIGSRPGGMSPRHESQRGQFTLLLEAGFITPDPTIHRSSIPGMPACQRYILTDEGKSVVASSGGLSAPA